MRKVAAFNELKAKKEDEPPVKRMHVDESNASTNASANVDETGADRSGGLSADAGKGPGQVPGSEGGASADAGQAVPGGL